MGSNLGDRQALLEAARLALDALPETQIVRTSSLYETEPVGGPAQGRFLNAVVELSTGLSPEELLEALLAIERQQGRVRTVRDGPRSLDLDLLVYGEHRRTGPSLMLPHPRMRDRAFVLEPLAEIAPHGWHPECGSSFSELAARVRDPQNVRLYEAGSETGENRWPSSL